ncbi:MAG: hypothetical protein WDN29_10725 [Methylovirgula sp.]
MKLNIAALVVGLGSLIAFFVGVVMVYIAILHLPAVPAQRAQINDDVIWWSLHRKSNPASQSVGSGTGKGSHN